MLGTLLGTVRMKLLSEKAAPYTMPLHSGAWKVWIRRDGPLILTAGFGLIWILHRALVQSITLDEANTFLRWVAPNSPTHWEPNSNNHVLNSALMRLFIWLFGLNHLTMRAPALLGGALYILVNYRLSALVASGGMLRWSLFACCVYNPFIMDYLVAARGYGLALGFLSVVIYVFARTLLEDADELGERRVVRRAAAISAYAGLAICANFTFAYASGFLLLASASVVGARWIGRKQGALALTRLAAAYVLPAVAVLLVLAGSSLTRFPRDQLIWGSDSLVQSWRDIREASFLELNPYLVNPLLANLLETGKGRVFQVLAVFGGAYVFLLFAARRQLSDSRARTRLILAASLTLVLALTVLACWLQFKLMGIPLPLERTSIFVVPLATVMLGAAVSALPFGRVAPHHWMARAVRGLGIAILSFAAFYFAGELRDSYFRLWREGADVRAAFPVILDLCRRSGVREVASDPNLTSSLNFYRVAYQANDINEFLYSEAMPANKSIYVVLERRQSRDVLRREGLHVAWRGQISGLLVLVRPEISGIGHVDPGAALR